MADEGLRMCIPMLDVINRQIDREGLELVLSTGGEGCQMSLTAEIKRMTVSAHCHCLHNVRHDHS